MTIMSAAGPAACQQHGSVAACRAARDLGPEGQTLAGVCLYSQQHQANEKTIERRSVVSGTVRRAREGQDGGRARGQG